MTQKKVVVGFAQKNLRPLLYNFHPYLRQAEFKASEIPTIRPQDVYNVLGTYQQEIQRTKNKHWTFRLREIIGIPNFKINLKRGQDVLFSYGGLLLSFTPYVIYIENGIAPFAYNADIAKNKIASRLVAFLITRQKCRQIVFMSEAAQKSFFTTTAFSKREEEQIMHKSQVLPPIARNPGKPMPQSNSDGLIRFLFIGTFYMKGGKELLAAFRRVVAKYPQARLTIVAKKELISPSDLAVLKNIPQIQLISNDYDTNELFLRFYNTHDVFVYPTYRDSFGAVLIEALAAHLPVIATDQYATSELVRHTYNGLLYPNHPLKDYNPTTYKMLGKYYNPKDFYQDLFHFQQQGILRPIEDFLFKAMESMIANSSLRERFSKNSETLYNQKYHYQTIAAAWDQIFLSAAR